MCWGQSCNISSFIVSKVLRSVILRLLWGYILRERKCDNKFSILLNEGGGVHYWLGFQFQKLRHIDIFIPRKRDWLFIHLKYASMHDLINLWTLYWLSLDLTSFRASVTFTKLCDAYLFSWEAQKQRSWNIECGRESCKMSNFWYTANVVYPRWRFNCNKLNTWIEWNWRKASCRTFDFVNHTPASGASFRDHYTATL